LNERRLLRLYEEDLTLRCSERTVPEYVSHLRSFVCWAQGRGFGLAAIRGEHLQAYQADLFARRQRNGHPYSAGAQANRLSALKSFFRFLVRRGVRRSDPSAVLERPRIELRLPRTILTPGEAERLVEAPRGRSPLALRDRALLETLYATGARASELIQLSPGDVDTEELLLRIVRGKGGKDRNLPLTPAAARALSTYLAQGRPRLLEVNGRLAGIQPALAVTRLFVSVRGGRLYRSTLNRLIHGCARDAGLEKHVTAHVLRHSVATQLLRRGADIRHIQELLGHASLSTTQRYTRVEISDLRAVVRRAHPRGR